MRRFPVRRRPLNSSTAYVGGLTSSSIPVASLRPDRQGFGRRKMVMPPASFRNCLAAQGGALLAICRLNGLEKLSHWCAARTSIPDRVAAVTLLTGRTFRKPHGQAYLMSAADLELARASASCAKLFGVPMIGLPGSAHEQAATEAGVAFLPEWYIDLEYADDGSLAPPDRRNYKPASEADVIARVTRLLTTREYATLSGKTLRWPASTVSICVHGDLPGATELAASVRKAIDALQ
jgi:UPF0271 protein